MELFDIVMAGNTARPENYQPLYFNDEAVGILGCKQIELLQDFGFRMAKYKKGYAWQEAKEFDSNNEKLAELTTNLREAGHIPGWRDELYALAVDYQHPPQAVVERASVPIFGGCGYGVHVNGLVEKSDGIYMWLGKRSLTKPTSPSKLDQIAAGGQPYNISPFENMQKECSEEANLSYEITAQAKSVGMGSYFSETSNGIRADVMFLYDLWLPETLLPQNIDGEVVGFELIALSDLPALLKQGNKVKFNSALVMIDCLIRHGVITEKEPNYQLICDYLHPRSGWLQMLLK